MSCSTTSQFETWLKVEASTYLNISQHLNFCTPYTCLVFYVAPGNVWCHHSIHLMGYFEFLRGSIMTCLPLNISEKLYWQHLFEKLKERDSLSSSVNTIQHPRIQKNNIDHSSKQGSPLISHSHTKTVLGQVLVHSDDKAHVLVVTVVAFVEYTFFQFC